MPSHESLAAAWNEIILGHKVVKVETTTWPRVCSECGNSNLRLVTNCWKCSGSGEGESEPALKVTFDNASELYIRSEFGAALFVKVDND